MTRFNFTERRRIVRDSFKLSAYSAKNRFLLDVSISLKDYNLESDGRVYLEIVPSGLRSTRRIEFGSVRDSEHPRVFTLPEEYQGRKLRGQIYITPKISARLLARSEPFQILEGENGPEEQESLLSIRRSSEIGVDLWRMDFEEYGEPTLLINDMLEDEHQFFGQPLVQALLFPTIIRDTVQWLSDEMAQSDDFSETVYNWILMFSQAGLPIEDLKQLVAQGDRGEYGDGVEFERDLNELKNTFAEDFCRRHGFLQKYFAAVEGE